MKDIFLIYKNEIIYTTIIVVSLLIIQFTMKKAAHRVGKQSEIHISRTRLMLKYINILVSLIAIFALAFAWGIGYKDLSLIFSSVFAVIGVALFAIWSILSNVTSGIILFFSFPYTAGYGAAGRRLFLAWGISAAGCGLQSALFFLAVLLRQFLTTAVPSLAAPVAWLAVLLSCGLEIMLAALSVLLAQRLFKEVMSIASMPEPIDPSMPGNRP